MSRKYTLAAILRCLIVSAVLLLSEAAQARAAVVVSSKLSSESAMIGQMIRMLLNAAAIPTVDRTTLGATYVVRKALIAGEIDLYVEYTGNAGFFFNIPADPAWKDLRKGYELGAKLDYQTNHIVWLTPANASNTWALAVRKDVARAPVAPPRCPVRGAPSASLHRRAHPRVERHHARRRCGSQALPPEGCETPPSE